MPLNRWYSFGVAVCFALPLLGCASKTRMIQANPSPVTVEFDTNGDGIIDQRDWRRMKESERRTYARKALEEIGENPDATVTGKKTREMLLLEGLNAVYGK